MTEKEAIACLQYWYPILKEIPESNWQIGSFTNGTNRCCVLGHVQRLATASQSYDADNVLIWSKVKPSLDLGEAFYKLGYFSIVIVNDTIMSRHPFTLGLHTPKARVMAAFDYVFKSLQITEVGCAPELPLS